MQDHTPGQRGRGCDAQQAGKEEAVSLRYTEIPHHVTNLLEPHVHSFGSSAARPGPVALRLRLPADLPPPFRFLGADPPREMRGGGVIENVKEATSSQSAYIGLSLPNP